MRSKSYYKQILRPIERYISSAKIEAKILEILMKHPNFSEGNIVSMTSQFDFEEKGVNYYCMVFEPLSISLYDVIKLNDYRGRLLI